MAAANAVTSSSISTPLLLIRRNSRSRVSKVLFSSSPSRSSSPERPPPPLRGNFSGIRLAETVDLGFEKTRVDSWISSRIPGISRARVQSSIRSGLVTINGRIIDKVSHFVKGGDKVSCMVCELEPLKAEPEEIPLNVVYEDEHVLVVNKPAHMVVHPAPGNANGTLVNAILNHCQLPAGACINRKSSSETEDTDSSDNEVSDFYVGHSCEEFKPSSSEALVRPGIVHRLDKGTSGLLVVAKDEHSHAHLAEQFKLHTIHRLYVSLTSGVPSPSSGRIEIPIARDCNNRTRMAAVSGSNSSRNARNAASNNKTAINSIIQQLSHQFSLKNLGPVSHFLGLQILHTHYGFFINQSQYALDLLQKAGMKECKPVLTPNTLAKTKDRSVDAPLQDVTSYRKVVGSLQYLTLTRPDIAFTVNQLCQYMHTPTTQHHFQLQRLLRYIKGTSHLGLPIQRDTLNLNCYADADWASDTIDRKSTSGICAFLGSTLISWSAKKQHTVARSSTEAEYRALAAATSEIIWLRRLLQDFQIHIESPTPLYTDSISAMAIANNPIFHARTKHIEIDYQFIRQHIQFQHIQVLHINTNDQPADILTKPMSHQRFTTLRDKLTIRSPPVSLRGGIKHTAGSVQGDKTETM